MIYRSHIPRAPLSEFIEWFWYYEGLEPEAPMERVLPHGALELIIDLRSEPKRLFDREDQRRFTRFRRGWLSGAHSGYIVIEAMAGGSMIGAHFKPGGAHPFFRFPVNELQDSVVELENIWGRAFDTLRDELLEAPTAAAKFRVLEEFLLEQARGSSIAPLRVSYALKRFEADPSADTIQSLAGELGVSHKHFIHEFSRWVGLTPKLFCRIRRFQQVLARIETSRAVEWADVSNACGYYDQAHFIRDFRHFSGLNPSAYVTDRGGYLNHVPFQNGVSGGR